jgi:hypothetical protein
MAGLPDRPPLMPKQERRSEYLAGNWRKAGCRKSRFLPGISAKYMPADYAAEYRDSGLLFRKIADLFNQFFKFCKIRQAAPEGFYS